MAIKYECPRCGRRFVEWGAERFGFRCPQCQDEELIRLGGTREPVESAPSLRRKPKAQQTDDLPDELPDLEDDAEDSAGADGDDDADGDIATADSGANDADSLDTDDAGDDDDDDDDDVDGIDDDGAAEDLDFEDGEVVAGSG